MSGGRDAADRRDGARERHMQNWHSVPGTMNGRAWLGDNESFLLSTSYTLRGKLFSKHTLFGRNENRKKCIVHLSALGCRVLSVVAT